MSREKQKRDRGRKKEKFAPNRRRRKNSTRTGSREIARADRPPPSGSIMAQRVAVNDILSTLEQTDLPASLTIARTGKLRRIAWKDPVGRSSRGERSLLGRSFARRMRTKFSDRTLPSNPAAACQISRGCGSFDPQGVWSAKQRLVADAVTGTNRSQPGKRSPGWPRSNRPGVHRVNL